MKYEFAEFVFEPSTRELTSDDGRVQLLQPKVAGVLATLVRSNGGLVTKHDLLREVWKDVSVSDGSVARAVRLVRKALGDNYRSSALVSTAWRRGYRLTVPVRILEALPAQRSEPREACGAPSVTGRAPEPMPLAARSARGDGF